MLLFTISSLLKNKQVQLFILSMIFVLIIVLIWVLVLFIKKRIKEQRYYKEKAKEDLIAKGITSFGENEKKKNKIKTNNVSTVIDDKEIVEVTVTQEEVQEEQIEETQEEVQEEQVEETQEEVQEEQVEETQEEIQEEQVEETQEEVQEDQVEEIQEKVQEEQVEETQEEVQEDQVKETQEEVQEDQVEETQEEVQEEQIEETQEEVQEEQVEETQEEVQEEQIEETQEEVQEEQVEETQEEVQEEQVEETQEEVQEEQVEETQEEVQEEQVEEIQNDSNESKQINSEVNSLETQPIERVKKGRTYNGKYEIFQVADGYAYHLKASNGEILVTSETYRSREGVIKAINAVKRNLENGEVRIFADKKGKYKFKLVSKNYRVLAISSNYSLEKSAIRASQSFKNFAMKADIVDVELVDADAKKATIIQITAKEDKQDGKFIIEKYDGEYSWDLKASNGQILCQADGYTSKAGCYYSIETFKRNVETGTFKCVKDKTGNYCYKLYTANGRICAVGESYGTKAGAESAANSVVSFYKNAEIVEIKE